MTPLVANSSAPLGGARRATPVRSLLPLLLSFVGACAPVVGSSRAAAPVEIAPAAQVASAERVLWVRTPDVHTNTEVVLDGAPVKVLSGARKQRGDTVYASAAFAVALPADAFEMRITAQRFAPGGLPVSPRAHVEFTSVNANGQLERVRAEGAELVLRRSAADQPLEILGAARRSATRLTSRNL